MRKVVKTLSAERLSRDEQSPETVLTVLFHLFLVFLFLLHDRVSFVSSRDEFSVDERESSFRVELDLRGFRGFELVVSDAEESRMVRQVRVGT